jgi:NAD(P)H-dependent flavin oxidoreductase YrpB (nitropropane dioxygenase family)
MAGGHQSAARESGDVECSPFPVGLSIGVIQDVVSCEELIARMMREAENTLTRVRQRLASEAAT